MNFIIGIIIGCFIGISTMCLCVASDEEDECEDGYEGDDE